MPSWLAKRDASFGRYITLACSVLASLAAGTNYVYSAYAPQLGSKLQISHTQLNIIGLSGNIGVYSTGPLWGALVDARGPRVLFITAVCLLFLGYFGIKLFYDSIIPLPGVSHHVLTPGLLILSIFAYCTGAGGNAGLTASLNATAKSFPDKMRATVAGLVVSGFGLSAFFFSTLAHTVFPGDTSSFLLVLALGTTIPMMIGIFAVKPVPTSTDDVGTDEYTSIPQYYNDAIGGRAVDFESTLPTSQTGAHARRTSRSREYERRRSRSPSSSFDLPAAEFGLAHPLDPPQSFHDLEHINQRDGNREVVNQPTSRVAEDVSSKPLFKSTNFWILFAYVSLLAGTGLMWINNVGSITQVLVAQGSSGGWDKARAASLQAAQVSTISLMNCLGRIVVGMCADVTKHHWGIRRCTWLVPIAVGFILSQVLASRITVAETLWMASALLGLSYGAMFSLAPVITLEWFGLEQFSFNWGVVALSPVLGGNLFSLAFGRNLDAHATPSSSSPSHASGPLSGFIRADLPDGNVEQLCFEGLPCYAASLRMTVVACSLALVLSLWAVWWDWREHVHTEKSSYVGPPQGEEDAGLLSH